MSEKKLHLFLSYQTFNFFHYYQISWNADSDIGLMCNKPVCLHSILIEHTYT